MPEASLALPLGSQESTRTKRRDDLLDVNMDLDLERKAVRRIDYTVLPIVTMFYLLSFLVSAPDRPQLDSGAKYIIQDRANIGD
jgi:hypothetical protein